MRGISGEENGFDGFVVAAWRFGADGMRTGVNIEAVERTIGGLSQYRLIDLHKPK